MWPTHEILAQKTNFDWESLIYILIFLILPVLKGLGDWVRKKIGNEGATQDDRDAAHRDTAHGGTDELILRPDPTDRRHTQPVRTPAQRQTARPSIPMPAPPPPRSTYQAPTHQTPHAKPAQQQRPAARPAPQAPQPTRAHPARRQPAQSARTAHSARTAQSTRVAHGRAAKAIESHSLLEEEAVEALLLEEQDSLRGSYAAHDLIADETFDAQCLKKAFILSEILAPPLAIRPAGNSLFSQLE